MTPTDTLIFEKKKTGDEWAQSGSFNMTSFVLDDYGHTLSEIVNNFHNKVKDKYSATKCGKIDFEFKQCFPVVNITGDCHSSEKDSKKETEKRKTLKENLIKDIIKDSKGTLINSSSDKIDKIDDSFFNDYLKNGISIHVRYSIRDCEPLPPGPKSVPSKDCKYEALYKIILAGPCDKPYDSKLELVHLHYLNEINKKISKKYEDFNIEAVVKPVKNDKVSMDIIKEGRGIIFHGGSKIHEGSSFGKRKSIMNKKNPKKKVYKKRFSKC